MSIFTKLFNRKASLSETAEGRDELLQANIALRAALQEIRAHGISSPSGTARAMARRASEALQ
jgi:hypothetical protein